MAGEQLGVVRGVSQALAGQPRAGGGQRSQPLALDLCAPPHLPLQSLRVFHRHPAPRFHGPNPPSACIEQVRDLRRERVDDDGELVAVGPVVRQVAEFSRTDRSIPKRDHAVPDHRFHRLPIVQQRRGLLGPEPDQP